MKKSAGVLIYQMIESEARVLIIHSSGREDLEPWSIPKGEFDARTESPRQAAIREVREELGLVLPEHELMY